MRVLFLFFTDPPRPFSPSVAALAAVVRASGHEASALEVSLRSKIDEVAARIESLSPDVLAVSAMSRDWPGAQTLLSRVVPRIAAYVVVGGYHASMAPHDVARCASVDAIAIGEGERPLRALLDQLPSGRPTRSIPGLWVRGPDGFTGPPPSADPEPDIAALLPWDYDVFGDLRASLARGINTFGPHVDRFLPTRASRGCPFTCSYCSAPRWGKLHAFETRRNVIPVAQLCDELSRLRDRYAPDGFEFWDEHFPIDLEWLDALAKEYPRRVALPFKVEMHPSAASRRRLELLKEAGCVLFHCGVEAGDEELRREVLHRRTRDVVLQRVFDDARAVGLGTSASLMTVLPGETRAQAHSTVALLRKLRPGSFMWSTYHALPGTVLGEASTDRWPDPARERFDDWDLPAPRVPSAMNERERNDTFRELAELQSDLVRAASREADAPTRARPVEIPHAPRRASTALAALLGLAPPGATTQGMRLETVREERGTLVLELDDAAARLPRQRIVLGPRDGSPYYRASQHVAISYRGREAPPHLLRAIDEIAVRLGTTTLDDLRRAL
ncbi:B12-binding domain-containing radical SAM protein [Sandaracinus amylolyticus]|uniref:Radical SAM domain protein n=1 Tax=Sandaracinus amylolyticus TaxID=927083 RepID=A0A0F6SDC7_9BACT|nr:radical SAM protein [Sandaracinus amylolyticus]AKF03214.1 Radical SAM domain protein [Sandaracinus amylolyticus]